MSLQLGVVERYESLRECVLQAGRGGDQGGLDTIDALWPSRLGPRLSETHAETTSRATEPTGCRHPRSSQYIVGTGTRWDGPPRPTRGGPWFLNNTPKSLLVI